MSTSPCAIESSLEIETNSQTCNDDIVVATPPKHEINSRSGKRPTSRGQGSRNTQQIESPSVHRKQLVHFVSFTILPAAALIYWVAAGHGPSSIDLAVFGSMWFLTSCVGVSIGLHRYFSHRSFKASPSVEWLLAIFAEMACQGPISYWVALHRAHHKFSDRHEDPHTPSRIESGKETRVTLLSFLHGHIGWVPKHSVPRPGVFAKDVCRIRTAKICDRYYFHLAILGIVIPGVVCMLVAQTVEAFWSGVIWGGFARILFANNVTWAVNSIGHLWGSQPFSTSENSRNSFLLAIPSFGEGWHNNHHAFPWSAKLGLKWWEIDFGWIVLLLLRRLGAISDVKSASTKLHLLNNKRK